MKEVDTERTGLDDARAAALVFEYERGAGSELLQALFINDMYEAGKHPDVSEDAWRAWQAEFPAVPPDDVDRLTDADLRARTELAEQLGLSSVDLLPDLINALDRLTTAQNWRDPSCFDTEDPRGLYNGLVTLSSITGDTYRLLDMELDPNGNTRIEVSPGMSYRVDEPVG